MSWLVIVLILVAAFGPLLWMLPSSRDRRLTKMRARARSLGLQVEITQLPDIAAEPHERVTAGGVPRKPMVSCAAYRFALPRMARAAPQWRLLRGGTDGPVAGWQWDGEPAGEAAYWREARSVFDELPADALACSARASEVACWWRENVPVENAEKSVDSLHGALAKLAELQSLTDAAVRAAAADEESGGSDRDKH